MKTFEITILNNYLKAFESALDYYNSTSHYQVETCNKSAFSEDFTKFKLKLKIESTNTNFLFEIGRLYEKFIHSQKL